VVAQGNTHCQIRRPSAKGPWGWGYEKDTRNLHREELPKKGLVWVWDWGLGAGRWARVLWAPVVPPWGITTATQQPQTQTPDSHHVREGPWRWDTPRACHRTSNISQIPNPGVLTGEVGLQSKLQIFCCMAWNWELERQKGDTGPGLEVGPAQAPPRPCITSCISGACPAGVVAAGAKPRRGGSGVS
jgi:hypothetical protein